MSRVYYLRLPLQLLIEEAEAERLTRLCLEFPVLEVLDPARMETLIRDRLTDLGWQEDGLGALQKAASRGIVWRIDPAARRLTVQAPEIGDQQLIISLGERPGPAGDVAQSLEGAGISAADPVVRREILRFKEGLREELIRATVQARRELNQVLKGIYQEALKEKARQLGTIASIRETSDGGRTRIHIEVT